MEKDKIETLLGFAVKAGKLIYGTDNIKKAYNKICLALISHDLSPNSKKEVLFAISKVKAPALIPQKTLEEILFRPGCKAAALTDKQMASAIMQNINENYKLVKTSEETN